MYDQDDIYWIERMLEGETEAFGNIVGKYRQDLYGLAVSITRNGQDAEEVTQDAFVKAFLNLQKFRRDSSLPTWLYHICYNCAVTYLRKNRKNYSHDIEKYSELSGESSGEYLEKENRFASMEKAISQLNEEERALVELFYYHRKPVREIKAILNMSESNIKVKLHRLRKKLAEVCNNKIGEND